MQINRYRTLMLALFVGLSSPITAEDQRFGDASSTIMMRASFVTMPQSAVNDLEIDWKLIDSAEVEQASDPEARTSEATDIVGVTRASADLSVDNRLPVLYAAQNREGVSQLLAKLVAEDKCRVVHSPKMVCDEGKSFRSTSFVQRPFVVGFTGTGLERQPSLRIVDQGWEMKVKPMISNDQLQVDYELNSSSIRSTRVVELPAFSDGKRLSVQVPEVMKWKTKISTWIPVDQDLLILAANPNATNDDDQWTLTALRMLNDPEQILKDKEAGLTGQLNEKPIAEEGVERFPLLGPIANSWIEDPEPPSDHEVVQLMEKLYQSRNQSLSFKTYKNLRIVKEKKADYVDAKKHYPLVGPASLRHRYFDCTVYVQDSDKTEEVYDVVHIDHNFLIMAGK